MRNTGISLLRKWLAGVGLISILVVSACSDSSVSADENRANPESKDKSIVERVADVIRGPETVEVPAGTLITAEIQEPLSSKTAQSGSSFQARLVEPVKVDDKTVIEPGADIQGVIREVERSKRVKGRASMVLGLESISVSDDTSVDVDTERLQIKAGGNVKKDALTIGGSSAVGAVIGAIAGGGDAAAKGAGIGAAAGTGYVLLTRGDEVKIPAGTKIAFVLANDVKVPVQQ